MVLIMGNTAASACHALFSGQNETLKTRHVKEALEFRGSSALEPCTALARAPESSHALCRGGGGGVKSSPRAICWQGMCEILLKGSVDP